ncbi:flavodoxin family protein [Pectinatus frisingensis]|uniref:flavodoxin family protein n=1 Tax=Pectinatus frisingensis TaxID=865 RepID=UPI0018C81790|nr:flavodoxin family protein [Pectinatus frisingensis]
MKFIAFNGSPGGADSSTNVITEAFLRGAAKAGANTENIFLIDKKIEYCKGCFACWFKTPGKCVLQDDMKKLLDKYNEADIVCFASPVYTWNMTAVLKNFVDRLIPLKSPLIINSGGKFDLVDSKPKTQQFVVISNCGFPGNNNFKTIKAVFASCNPVLEIYRSCGKLLKNKDAKIGAAVNQYLHVVEQAGYELAKQNHISERTKSNLDMQLMSIPDYVKYIGMQSA